MNHLHYGDNLDVLRTFADDSVDLIYLDPPFNSNADYNQLFRGPKGQASPAQVEAFTDTWQWDDAVSGRAVAEVKASPHQDAARMLDAMVGFLGKNALTAYLAMMAVRLVELHRVLRPTGSLYLHCDPTASHYLKVLLDGVFGARLFRNEIVWKRSHAQNNTKGFGPAHDVIFAYSKSADFLWNPVFQQYDSEYIDKHYRHVDAYGRRYKHENPTGAGVRRGETGMPWRGINPTGKNRHWAKPPSEMEKMDAEGRIYWPSKPGSWPYIKLYLDEMQGARAQDVWTDIAPINMMAGERLGYPTQKPVALLERIVAASSNPGDVVLDPFCGCGTTVHAAEKLGRQWIGIDVTHLAIGLIEHRLKSAFPGVQFQVHGTPRDVDAARDFFERDDKTKKEFEKWAVSLLGFQPQARKGADGGMDGQEWFGPGKAHRAVVSVKGGKSVTVEMMRSLDAVTTAQGADVGVLLSLEPPTRGAVDWARQAGLFAVPGTTFAVPRLQVVTIEDALRLGEDAVRLPLRHDDTFKKAPKEAARPAARDLFG